MRLPSPRKLDDRVLGDRLRGPRGRDDTDTRGVDRRPHGEQGAGRRQALSIVYKVARVVFLLLALIVVLGIVFTLTPSNPDNALVRNALSLAETAAGPFADLFTVGGDPERALAINYSVAAVLYLLAGTLVTRLPGGRR